jgi:hypothetical protein
MKKSIDVRVLDALEQIVDAYVDRFKQDNAGRRLFGPIDEQVKHAQSVLRSLAKESSRLL